MTQSPSTATGLYKRLLGYAAPYWRQFSVAVLAMVLFAATETGLAALMKPMLDGNFIERDPQAVRFVPLALIALFVLRGVTGFASRYAMTWIGRRVVQELRRAGRTSVMRHVDLANRYLEDRADAVDR